MSLHPAWQHTAQAEIDRVCGDRMPTRTDFAELPTAEGDDVYRGVPIKKDTIVMAFKWAINSVPERYPDPDIFHPERYLAPGWPTYTEPLSTYPNLRNGASMHTFGWGRRTCLGKDMADDELFVCCAALLWGFTRAQKTCPLTGEAVPIDWQATNAHVILEPSPFQLCIRSRSAQRAQQIMDGYSAVREQLRVEMLS